MKLLIIEEISLFFKIWRPALWFEEKVLLNATKHIVSNGATYSGQLKHKTFEGKKIFIQHGKGIQLWKDGAKYEGDWRNGRAHGSGTFFHANGDKYTGLFQKAQANGFGVYTHSSGK